MQLQPSQNVFSVVFTFVKNHAGMFFWCKFKTYYLVEAVDSSLQETDFKVKNTFDKKHYFCWNWSWLKNKNISSLLWTLKVDFDKIDPHFWNLHSFLIIFIVTSFVLCIYFHEIRHPPCPSETRGKHNCTIIARRWVSICLVYLSWCSYFYKRFRMSDILLHLV